MLLVVLYEVSVCERPSERVCFLTEPLLAFLAAQIILCKTILDLIWFWLTLLSGSGQTDLDQRQASVQ